MSFSWTNRNLFADVKANTMNRVMPQFRARRECSDLPRGGWFSDFLLDKMRSLGYPNLGCSEQRRPMRLHPSSR